VRQNYFDYSDKALDSFYDALYDSSGSPAGDPNYENGALVAGIDLTRFTQNTNTLLLKGSYLNQANTVSQFKAGAELQLPRVSFGTNGYLTFRQVGNQYVPWLESDGNTDPNTKCLGILARTEVFPDGTAQSDLPSAMWHHGQWFRRDRIITTAGGLVFVMAALPTCKFT